ncbi:hypothetical protein JOC37_000070 [Desulfohalotomaculum tongense]|nr:hypothetical protein [Desulforadius tongensis]
MKISQQNINPLLVRSIYKLQFGQLQYKLAQGYEGYYGTAATQSDEFMFNAAVYQQGNFLSCLYVCINKHCIIIIANGRLNVNGKNIPIAMGINS